MTRFEMVADRIVKAHKNGWPYSRMQKEICVSNATIARALREAGLIGERTQRGTEASKEDKFAWQLATIREMAPTHYAHEICRAVRMGKGRLVLVMAEHGIEPRTKTPITPEKRAQIEALLRGGIGLHAAAARARVSTRQVRQVKMDLSIETPTNKFNPHKTQTFARVGEVRREARYDWMRGGQPFHVTVNERGITLPAVNF